MVGRGQARSNTPLLLGLVAFTGFMCTVPFFFWRRQMQLQGPMWKSDDKLSTGQVRRGAYLNTGSRDAGPDRDWDHDKFLYKGKAPGIIDENTGLSAAGSASMRAGPGRRGGAGGLE
jgi:hypothetical protein